MFLVLLKSFSFQTVSKAVTTSLVNYPYFSSTDQSASYTILPSSTDGIPPSPPTSQASPSCRPRPHGIPITGPPSRCGQRRCKWHIRGRRAGRIVQARRLLARNADQQRHHDNDRALIPLSGPGLAPGIGDSSLAQTQDRPGPAADRCRRGSGSDGGFRRVEGHLSTRP